MVEELIKDWSRFDKLWDNAKSEIFRVQLLNEYNNQNQRKAFENYKKGIVEKEPEFEEWLNTVKTLTTKGVKIINLFVVDLPFSEYKIFAIEHYLFPTIKKGQVVMMVERNKLNQIVKGIEDFWMFDRKIAIPLVYDKKGEFLGLRREVINKKIIEDFTRIEEALIKVAMPLQEFLEGKNINLSNNSTI